MKNEGNTTLLTNAVLTAVLDVLYGAGAKVLALKEMQWKLH